MPLLIFDVNHLRMSVQCDASHSVYSLFDGFQAAVGGPEIPLFQKGFGKN